MIWDHSKTLLQLQSTADCVGDPAGVELPAAVGLSIGCRQLIHMRWMAELPVDFRALSGWQK